MNAYRIWPLESYSTEEGCEVVSQICETPDLLIENVALMCLRTKPSNDRGGDGSASV